MQPPPQPPAQPPQRPAPPIEYEEYVALSAAAKVWGATGMAGYYRIDMQAWEALQALWEPRIAHNPQLSQGHAARVDQEARRIQSGGQARPIGTLQYQNFERQAEQAGAAIGSAAVAGLSALGSAFGSVAGPTVGARVTVQWSDGQRYPGTIAQIAQGQYLVTMQNGQQHWIPSQFVVLA